MKYDFNRDEHVFKSDVFEEIVKDTVRFFNGTPVLPLPPEERFYGTGIYAIYYTGDSELYKATCIQPPSAHSALGYCSPAEFERRQRAALTP